MNKIIILNANPHKEAFISQLAQNFFESAKAAGHEVKLTHIADLKFDYNLRPGMDLEPDLIKQQADIKWADHVVVCLPIWWYAPPANLKAFFDRVLIPGFAYKHPHPWAPLRNFLPQRLLKGRSVRIITAQDSYRPISWIMGLPIAWSMRMATFWYVGFWPVRHTRFTRVRVASDEKRMKWTEKIKNLAAKAK